MHIILGKKQQNTRAMSRYMWWGSRPLEGTLPHEYNFPEIGSLFIFEATSIEGTMTPEICNNTSTEQILVWQLTHHTYLAGTLPTQIVKLNPVMFFRLSNNALAGTLPRENFISKGVSISVNRFTGTISSESFSKQGENSVIFHTNSLSGQLPAEFGNLTGLERALLERNHFEGMPDMKSTMFQTFRLQDNRISRMGALPICPGCETCTQLTINMYHNRMREMPAEWHVLGITSTLDMSHNALTSFLLGSVGPYDEFFVGYPSDIHGWDDDPEIPKRSITEWSYHDVGYCASCSPRLKWNNLEEFHLTSNPLGLDARDVLIATAAAEALLQLRLNNCHLQDNVPYEPVEGFYPFMHGALDE